MEITCLGNAEIAYRKLRAKINRDGYARELQRRLNNPKPSDRRRAKARAAETRKRKSLKRKEARFYVKGKTQ